MMKLWMTVLCVIIMVIVPASGVFAYSVNVGDLIKLQDGPGTTGGGEFIVTDTTGNPLFNTFCVEKNEYINFYTTYKVDSITNSAIEGGISGGSPDQLDPETEYLYYNFAMGTLTNYDHSVGDANALQQA